MPRRLRALGAAVAAAILAAHFTAAPLPAQAPAERQVTFRLIVVSTEAAARSVLERLRRGAEADALAAAESIDPSAVRGGLIGPVESVLHQVPYGMGSGWSTWQESLSSEPRG